MRSFLHIAPIVVGGAILLGCAKEKDAGGDVSPPLHATTQNPVNSEPVAHHTVDSIRYNQGLVTIEAQNMSLHKLLHRISILADFRLENHVSEEKRASISIQNVALEDALRVILHDVPYKITYDNISLGPVHKISYLSVGIPRPSVQEDLADFARKKAALMRADQKSDLRVMTLKREQLQAMSGAEQLEAVAQLQPTPENMPLLLDILKNHKEPEMRIAAMAAIENADMPEAVHALELSLDDHDVAVVLAAIDSIEFAGGSEQASALTKLLQHSNPEVRAAASEAIEFLR